MLSLKLTLKCITQNPQTHTRAHTHRQYGWTMLGSSLTDSEGRVGASCSCPTSAQLSRPRAAFEQPITPTQHRGKAISARGVALTHQMVWEMNRAIILVLDNSSDEAN